MNIIYTSGNTSKAYIISGLLNSHGIEAHIGGKYLQGGIGEFAAMDFVNVQVLESDVERAREIIAEYDGVQTGPQKTAFVKKHSM